MDFQNTLTPLFIVPGGLLKYFLQAFGFYMIISYFMEIHDYDLVLPAFLIFMMASIALAEKRDIH